MILNNLSINSIEAGLIESEVLISKRVFNMSKKNVYRLLVSLASILVGSSALSQDIPNILPSPTHPLQGVIESEAIRDGAGASDKLGILDSSVQGVSNEPNVGEIGNSQSADLLFSKAQEFIAKNQLEPAKQILSDIAERNVDNEKAFAKLGEISLKSAKPEDALPYLWIARDLEPNDEKSKSELAMAENLLRSRVRHYHIYNCFPAKGDVRALLNEGVRLWAIGCPDQAAYLFKYVTKKDPANISAFFDLGAVAEWNGNLPQALDYYKQADLLIASRQIAKADHEKKKSLFGHLFKVPEVSRALWGYANISELSSELAKAEAEVQQRIVLGADKTKTPVFDLKARGAVAHTCARCEIVRGRKMDPG